MFLLNRSFSGGWSSTHPPSTGPARRVGHFQTVLMRETSITAFPRAAAHSSSGGNAKQPTTVPIHWEINELIYGETTVLILPLSLPPTSKWKIQKFPSSVPYFRFHAGWGLGDAGRKMFHSLQHESNLRLKLGDFLGERTVLFLVVAVDVDLHWGQWRFLLHRSEIERNAFVLVVAPLCPFVQVFVSAASLLCKYWNAKEAETDTTPAAAVGDEVTSKKEKKRNRQNEVNLKNGTKTVSARRSIPPNGVSRWQTPTRAKVEQRPVKRHEGYLHSYFVCCCQEASNSCSTESKSM